MHVCSDTTPSGLAHRAVERIPGMTGNGAGVLGEEAVFSICGCQSL